MCALSVSFALCGAVCVLYLRRRRQRHPAGCKNEARAILNYSPFAYTTFERVNWVYKLESAHPFIDLYIDEGKLPGIGFFFRAAFFVCCLLTNLLFENTSK